MWELRLDLAFAARVKIRCQLIQFAVPKTIFIFRLAFDNGVI